MNNPWQQKHQTAERTHHPRTEEGQQYADAIVASEYERAPEPHQCRCGSLAYYKATIGAMKCPRCGALYTTQGDPII